MKRFLKFAILPVMTTLLLASCGDNGDNSQKPTYDGNYYDTMNTEVTGLRLQKELHRHMLRTHTFYPNYASMNNYFKGTATYTAEDGTTKTIPMSTDATKEQWQKGKYEAFYTAATVSKTTTLTREHVWPCANSEELWSREKVDATQEAQQNYVGGGSDLYHIRPVSYDVNVAHQNYRYHTFTSGEAVSKTVADANGKWKLKITTGKVEVGDGMKGDVARIGLYLYIHYNTFSITDVLPLNENVELGTLRFQKFMYIKANETEEDALRYLLEWHYADPVSEIEIQRNNTVEKIQGNRNPFVDHPEWVAECFE